MIVELERPLPADVLAFLDRAVSPRGARHWQWKYGRADSGKTPGFCWRDGDGRVLGFIGLLHTALLTSAGFHQAAWFVDWYVTPGQPGIGMSLLRRAEASTAILLTLQGSADSRQILPRLGWKESRAPVTWLRPLSRRFAAAWLGRRAPAGLGPIARGAAPLAAWLLRPRGAARPPGCELLAVEQLPATYYAVGDVLAAEATAMQRGNRTINWLCADYPEGGYRLWLLLRHGQRIGHLVTRCDADRHQHRRGRIVDAAWPWADAALGAWLVGEAVAALRDEGADYVECLASNPALIAALQRGGFRRRAAVPLWYHRLPAGVPEPDRWHITLLDCDRAYR